MFNWILFFCLVLVCIPGMLIAVRGALDTISRLAANKLPPGKEMPPRPVILLASTVQSLILIAAPAAIGTAVAHRVDLHAPLFRGAGRRRAAMEHNRATDPPLPRSWHRRRSSLLGRLLSVFPAKAG
ncbi:MAG: hypothetical protein GQ526_04355 [Ardenticatenales bacterium]|nr:hypothetical protein [Ardenticatenales bacterium]